MFTLWLHGEKRVFSPESCERILSLLRQVMEGGTCAEYHVDGPPPQRIGKPKRYKRAFFRFCKGRAATRVPKKRWRELALALEIAKAGGDSHFGVGIKGISAAL
jgi:hypothetical protein